MQSFVYILTNLANGKRYVGKANRPKRRWWKHVDAANAGRPEALYKAIRKYGKASFVMDIAGKFDSEAEALAYERELVDLMWSKGPDGYNMTAGGDGVLDPTGEVRQKMSESRIAVAKRKREALCPKDRRAPKCRYSAGFGVCPRKTVTMATRAKMRAKKLGTKKPASACEKMSILMTGRKVTWGDRISAGQFARHAKRKAQVTISWP